MTAAPRRVRSVLLAVVLVLPLVVGAAPATTQAAPDGAPPRAASAGGFLIYREVDTPVCVVGSGLNVSEAPYFTTGDCAFAVFTFTGVPDGATLTGELVGPDGAVEEVDEVRPPDADGEGRALWDVTETTPTGELTLRILVDGVEAGRTRVFHNVLDASIDVPSGLSPGDDVAVTGDVELLQRVFRAVLDNADRHGAPPARVTARRRAGIVTCRVEDAGPGLDPAWYERVFEPFVQGEVASAHRPGTGIGLTVSRLLVQAHGGEIHLGRSTALGGLAVEIRLPQAATIGDVRAGVGLAASRA